VSGIRFLSRMLCIDTVYNTVRVSTAWATRVEITVKMIGKII
jgi:hypothetical protein